MKRVFLVPVVVATALALGVLGASSQAFSKDLEPGINDSLPGSSFTQSVLGFKVDGDLRISVADGEIYSDSASASDPKPGIFQVVYDVELGHTIASITRDSPLLSARNASENFERTGIHPRNVPLREVQTELRVSRYTSAQIEQSLASVESWLMHFPTDSAWEYAPLTDRIKVYADLRALDKELVETSVPITLVECEVGPGGTLGDSEASDSFSLPQNRWSAPASQVYNYYKDVPTDEIYAVQYDVNSGRTMAVIPADSKLLEAKQSIEALSESGFHIQKGSVPPESIEMRISKYSFDQVSHTNKIIWEYVEENNISAAFEYDVWNDAFLITTDVSKINLGQLPRTPLPLILEDGEVSPAYFKEGATAPFNGGTTIYNPSNSRCTSGIPARNSAGTPGLFTAGHCFSGGESVWTSKRHDSTRRLGRVSHTFGYPTVDAQFISTGASYSSSITSWSGRNYPVVGVYDPPVGQRICYTGSSSGVQCGNYVVSKNATYYFSNPYVSFSGAIRIEGGKTVQHGDSGGPTYGTFGQDAKVTGLVSGFAGSSSYIQPWTRVASIYNASLF